MTMSYVLFFSKPRAGSLSGSGKSHAIGIRTTGLTANMKPTIQPSGLKLDFDPANFYHGY